MMDKESEKYCSNEMNHELDPIVKSNHSNNEKSPSQASRDSSNESISVEEKKSLIESN